MPDGTFHTRHGRFQANPIILAPQPKVRPLRIPMVDKLCSSKERLPGLEPRNEVGFRC